VDTRVGLDGCETVAPTGIQSPDFHDVTLDNFHYDPKDFVFLLHCE